jgi:uncharacterized protein
MFDNKWIIFETLAGSWLYGTNTPESDVDIRGVCIPPERILMSPFSNFEQHIETKLNDITIYGLRKFFQLAEDCNPNIIELLYSPWQCHRFINHQGKMLLDNANLFLSQKLRFTFTGYATSQLQRIKRHKKWIDNPIVKPLRVHYGLQEMPLFSYEKLLAILTSPEETIQEEWRDYAKLEMQYRQAKAEWDDYAKWLSERNPKRFELESKYGYDTKHGMHLFRLLIQAEELLLTGKIEFPLKEKDYLLSIRNGLYPYEELIEKSENFREKIDSIPSDLPKKPDTKKLEDLYFKILEG